MNESERQDAVDRRLWQRLKAGPPAPAGPCPEGLLLAAWLDGRATAGEARRVEAHLAACPACLAAARDLRRLLDAPPMVAPRAVVDRAKALVGEAVGAVCAAGAGRARAVRLAAGWRGIAQWAATAAAALAVGYLGFRAGQTAYGGADPVAALVREASFGLADAAGAATLDEQVLLAFVEGEP